MNTSILSTAGLFSFLWIFVNALIFIFLMKNKKIRHFLRNTEQSEKSFFLKNYIAISGFFLIVSLDSLRYSPKFTIVMIILIFLYNIWDVKRLRNDYYNTTKAPE